MRLVIHSDYERLSRWAAEYIAGRINSFNKNKPFVIALPTGSTSLGVYRELIKIHKEGKLSFENVRTFNLDEYCGLPPDHPQSYRYFMMDNFFNHIDIDPQHIHLFDGLAKDPDKECKNYEEAIAAEGGIELFWGGMGTDGHIAFNEPGCSLASRTRVEVLAMGTKTANARFFDNDPNKVPQKAFTMGVGTAMDAQEIIILSNGRAKARALATIVEGGVNQMWPLSCLQMHPNAMIICDDDATEELKVGTVKYFKDIEKGTINN